MENAINQGCSDGIEKLSEYYRHGPIVRTTMIVLVNNPKKEIGQ